MPERVPCVITSYSIHYTKLYEDESYVATANYNTATADAANLIVFSSRFNRSADFLDQKQDLWVLRNF